MELNYNRVHLCGQAEDVPALSHVNHGCAFYRFTLAVMRLSGQADRLPVIVPQTLLHAVPVAAGATVTVIGQLRSFNNKSGQGSRLVISVFAHQLTLGGESPFNQIQLSGILCRTPALLMKCPSCVLRRSRNFLYIFPVENGNHQCYDRFNVRFYKRLYEREIDPHAASPALPFPSPQAP